VRGIEVRGQAIALPTGGPEVHPGYESGLIRITPRRIVAWGIDDADPFRSHRRTVGDRSA
jgi:pyridoxamine 5'-phosphate oxidase family protein